ncbi:MAG: hypothetical protein QXY53_01385 [Desulfurococcaceae archaeon]
MNKTLLLLTILILVSIVPYTIHNVESLTIIDNVLPSNIEWRYPAYRATGAAYLYTSAQGTSPFNAYLVIAKPDGSYIVRYGSPYFSRTVSFSETAVDGNETHVAVAYRAYIAAGNSDIYVALFDYDGNRIREVVVDSAAGHQGLPVIKYGGGYWFIAYVDYATIPGSLVFRIYDIYFNLLYTQRFSIGYTNIRDGDAGLDYRERAHYSSVTGKFYLVFYDRTVGDLRLLVVDPKTRSHYIVDVTNDGSMNLETYAFYGRLYRRFYAKMLGDEKYLGIIYGYQSGSNNVSFAIVNLVDETVTRITLLETGGQTNFYPWISASSSEWLVTWWIGGTNYLAVVKPDGSFRRTIIPKPPGYTTPGYITSVYNGIDYVVIFAGRKGTQDDLFAVRYDNILKRSESVFVLSNDSAVSENSNYPLIIGDTITVLFSKGGAGSLAFLKYTEIPEPKLIPTEFIEVSITYDDGGDGFVEAGDRVVVSGKLIDQVLGTGIENQKVTVSLINVIWYDSRTRRTNFGNTFIEKTVITGFNGTFSVELTIPLKGLVSGTYRVELYYAGADPYGPAAWTEPYYHIIVRTKPSIINWVSVPEEIAIGPGFAVVNGQVIITDPVGEVATEYRVFRPITDFTGDESGDVDIKLLQLAIDNNYIYVKAVFDGPAGIEGSIAPALSLVFDFTPGVSSDGAEAGNVNSMHLIRNSGNSDTYLKGGRGWDLTVVLTPKSPGTEIYVDPTSNLYAVYIKPAYKYGASWYYYEMSAGYLKIDGNTMYGYIPLDTIDYYCTNFKPYGNVSWILFAAVFPIRTADGRIVPGIPFSNWVDVPGVVTSNSTPARFIEIGIRESATDDKITIGTLSSWELDTFFRLNLMFPSLEAKAKLLYVVDGDTVRVEITGIAGKFANKVSVGGVYYVRFADIDAPPLGTPEGDAAANALFTLLKNATYIYLDIDDKYVFDEYGRIVAVVYTRIDYDKLVNVNKWLVDNNYAIIDNRDNEFNPATWTLYVSFEKDRFFGRARLWVEETIIPVSGYPTISFDDKVAGYVGTAYYVVRAYDADNRVYGIPGLTVEMLVNGEVVARGVTGYDAVYNNVGNVTLAFKWLPEHRGKTHTVSFRTIATYDYASTKTIDFYVTPVYLGRVDYLNAYVVDVDGRPTVGMGDKIIVNIGLSVWNDVWEPAPVGTRVRVYLKSTPFYLGEAIVEQPGLAVLEYVVSGNEGLYDFNPTEHRIIVYGYPGEIWLIEVKDTIFPYSLAMIPVPEPAILPIALLSLMLLIVLIIKKRK